MKEEKNVRSDFSFLSLVLGSTSTAWESTGRTFLRLTCVNAANHDTWIERGPSCCRPGNESVCLVSYTYVCVGPSLHCKVCLPLCSAKIQYVDTVGFKEKEADCCYFKSCVPHSKV